MSGCDSVPLCEAAFEALPCEIIVHDIDTIVAANAAACRLLDAASPRSLVGLPVSTLTHPDARDAGAQRRRLLFSHAQSYSCVQVKLVGLKGRDVSTNVMARRFDVGDESYALVVGLDASSGCKPDFEEWQREMPTFPSGTPMIATIMDALPQPVTIFDTDDRIVYANVAAARTLRATDRNELIGRSPSTLLHPLVREAAAERRRMVLEQGQTFSGVRGKALALDGSSLDMLSSVGRAQTRDGGVLGYWIAHSIVPASPAVTV